MSVKHPDPRAEERALILFLQLNEAYSTLSDPAQREAYDRRYHSTRRARSTQARRDEPSSQGSHAHRRSEERQRHQTQNERDHEEVVRRLRRQIEELREWRRQVAFSWSEVQRDLIEISAELSRLRSEEAKRERRAKKDASKKTWKGWLTQIVRYATEAEEPRRRSSGHKRDLIESLERQLRRSERKLADLQTELEGLDMSIWRKQRWLDQWA
ncbi:hypothetical protein CDD83_8100 [Cordyceps sp. RAO-2017]|nr:hypothetical protein CDD83_8100 [Cordyceps sp. RAO-2017]